MKPIGKNVKSSTIMLKGILIHKSKAVGYIDTPEGQMKVEVHWMQCDGIGKVDFFVKRWLK